MTVFFSKLRFFVTLILIIFYCSHSFAEFLSDRDRSVLKTEKALEEIENHNFGIAFELLNESIRLDPSNEKAKELYVALYETMGDFNSKKKADIAEKEKKKEIIKKPEEKRRIVKRRKKPDQKKKYTAQRKKKKKEIKKKTLVKKVIKKKDEEHLEYAYSSIVYRRPVIKDFFIGTAFTYTSAESDLVSGVDSNIGLLGGELFTEVFLFNGNLSFSSDLKGTFSKTSGDGRVDVNFYYVDVAAKIRGYLFPVYDNYFQFGFKLSYTSFYLQNNEDAGAFNYTSVYGPKAGFFISDPVFSRFGNNNIFRNLYFELSVNMIQIPWDSEHPEVIETGFRINYKMNRLGYFLGYNMLQISNKYKDTYQTLEFGFILRL